MVALPLGLPPLIHSPYRSVKSNPSKTQLWLIFCWGLGKLIFSHCTAASHTACVWPPTHTPHVGPSGLRPSGLPLRPLIFFHARPSALPLLPWLPAPITHPSGLRLTPFPLPQIPQMHDSSLLELTRHCYCLSVSPAQLLVEENRYHAYTCTLLMASAWNTNWHLVNTWSVIVNVFISIHIRYDNLCLERILIVSFLCQHIPSIERM